MYMPNVAECEDGKYGKNCTSSCGQCLDGDICKKSSGICPRHCENGWTDEKCDKECEDGKYGKNCTSSCGQCLDGDICNKSSGICPRHCENGWTDEKCDKGLAECEDGKYGEGCSSVCGNCLNNDVCDKHSGICPGHCDIGWTGERCDQECVDGKYGENCSSVCGNCFNGDVCNKRTGKCPGHCDIGWIGEKCDEDVADCEDGKYGGNCLSVCGNCLNGDVCNKRSGTCPGHCDIGWTGVKCDKECEDGKYGESCSSVCGNCLNGDVCNKRTGICPGHCDIGWTGEKCDKDCEDGKYGENCLSVCGKCLNGDVCNKRSGTCPGYCDIGWTGQKCDKECEDGKYGNCSTLCGHCLNGDACNKTNGICPGHCEFGWTEKKCDKMIECPESVITYGHRTLKRHPTQVGKTFYTDNICHADDQPLGEMDCVDDGGGGAFWGPFKLNQACNFSSLAKSEISNSLLNLLVEDVNNTSIENVLEQTSNITSDRNLTELDVLYMTDILEKTSQLSEISPETASDIVEMYDTVVESASDTLVEAEEKGKVKNRILQTLDDVTAKLKPGPSGNNKIKTETFESEVWDLKSENVTRLPLGLSLSESPRDANDSSDTLYNDTVDYSKTDSAIMLPQEFLEGVVNDSQGKSIRLSMNLYRKPLLFSKSQTASERKGHMLNSKVISAKILVDDKPVTHLKGTQVTFIFKSNQAVPSAKHVCGYWNFTSGSWSTDGCHHKGVEAGRDVCVCDHLTNFATLLDFDGTSDESAHHLPLTVITMVGLILSMAGLSATVATYLTFRKLLKKDPQQTLFHLSLSQLCAWTVFLAGFNQTQSYIGCIVVAVLLHYFIMASFLWMLAEAFLHYMLLVKVHASGTITSHYMWKTGVPAWGLPILPVAIVLSMDVDLYRGRELHCWMSWTTSLYAFAIPIGLILLCNLLLYLLIVFNICEKRNVGQKKSEHKRKMLNARVSFFCFILFGLSWVFGYLAVAEAKVLFQYIFCVTASTQGFLIFLLFTARNKQVRESWRNLCSGKTKSGRRDISKMDLVSKSKSSGTAGTASVITNETNVGSSGESTIERGAKFGTSGT